LTTYTQAGNLGVGKTIWGLQMDSIEKFSALEKILGEKKLLWEIIQAMTDLEKQEYIEWICGNWDISEEVMGEMVL
tara:strand:- start:25 stop:252 length:228 start_codon:yes stop_codon:yes gene_type:complete